MEGNTKRVVLVHHHIFKNAGTSFNYALKQAFGDGFFEYDLPNSQVVTSENLASYLENTEKAVAVSGHHICFPTPQTEKLQTLSTVLIRHPLARVRSIYEFERKQDAQTEGAVMAKKLSFKDFVSWRLEHNSHVFCNYQTIYCSRKTNVKPSYKPTQQDLDLALENLDNCFAFGTVEQYQQFLMMAQYESRLHYPNIVFQDTRLNVTNSDTFKSFHQISPRDRLCVDLGQDIVEKLEQNNRLDYELYEIVCRKIEDWMTQNVDSKAHYFQICGNFWSEARDWEKARVVLNHLICLRPRSFKAYHDLGEALNRLGIFSEAIVNYQKSIELNPSFAWSYFRLAETLYRQWDWDRAEFFYKKAIENHTHEKSLTFYSQLVQCLIDQGKVDEAMYFLDQAATIPNQIEEQVAEIARLYELCHECQKVDTL